MSENIKTNEGLSLNNEEEQNITDSSSETSSKQSSQITADNIEDTLKNKGIDYKELQEEYLANGDLSEETRNKLSEIGITNEFIEDFIEGKKAIYEKQKAEEEAELINTVGGKDIFDETIKWAANNLRKEEILALNDIKNLEAQKWILKGIKAQMNEKEGVLPQYLQGSGHIQEDIFKSQAEVFEAIRDKRYMTDPAYQATVTKKIQASKKAGIHLGF